MSRSPRLPSVVTALLAVAGAIAPVAAPAVAAEDGGAVADERFPVADQVRAKFAEGVKEYRIGRYQAAAAAFAAALKLNPDDKLCYELYLAAGDGLLVQMEGYDELRLVLRDLLAKARVYQRHLRRDAAYIDLLITKLKAGEDERLVSTNELVAVGPIAVPRLLARLGDNRQDDDRVGCRIVLTRMGYRAVVPLVEALNAAEPRLLSTVIAILADIGDRRALPRLQLLLDDSATDATVRRVAENAVAVITTRSKSQSGTVESLYLAEALRYFRDGDQVRDEMIAAEALMWRWTEPEGGAKDGEAITKALQYVRVPGYAWNELMAEELLYDLAAARPAFAPAYPLLAADLAAQDVEVRRRARLVKESPYPARNSEGHPDAIAERATALDGAGSGMIDRVRLFGPVNLYRAFQQAVVADRFDAGAAIAEVLRDRAIAVPELHLPSATEGFTPDKAGTPLVAALDHGAKAVRYPAAMTLAHLDPAAVHANAEKVVPALSQAVGEWGMRVVLVVDQDYRYRNLARSALQAKGYLVRAVNDGFEAMQVLEEAPVKDAIIIPGDLLPTVRNAHGQLVSVPEQRAETLIAQLRADQRSAKTPIFVALPEDPELAAKIQTALTDKVDGFVKKPFDAVELSGKIETALEKAELPNVNREEAEATALAAAIALQQPDPKRTQYDLTLAAQALAATLENRADALRIEALKALAVAVRHPNGDKVRALSGKLTELYAAQDATLVPALRAAWVQAIGAIDPGTPAAADILARALAYDGPESGMVRAAAAAAAGRFAAVSAPVPADGGSLLRYLQDRRMDLRPQGAGAEPGATVPSSNAP
jgi:CheY-like chemotaxis protein